MPTIDCPHCDRQVFVEDRYDGHILPCPHCGGQFRFANSPPAGGAPDPPTVRASPGAGSAPVADEKYCHECGARIRRRAVVCPKCGVEQPGVRRAASAGYDDPPPETNRVAAGVFALLLGTLGIHKFILGYPVAGIVMLLVSVIGSFCFFLGPIVMGLVALIEGILYLSKSEEEFYRTYVENRRSWF